MASNYESFKEANKAFVETFTEGGLPLPPAKQTLVLACMDARLHPEKALGIAIGDSHVVRNAGGRASDDALRSIAISQRLLGTKEVHIIHHTDCGMLTFSNEDIHKKISDDLNADASHIDFLPFGDLEDSVVQDVKTVQESPLVQPGTIVKGYIYKVETGELVDVPTASSPKTDNTSA